MRCDETKPCCANCDRLRLRCAYKAPTALGNRPWCAPSSSRPSHIEAHAAAHAVSQSAPTQAVGRASAAAAVAAVANASQHSHDPTFFNTVLRSDEKHRTLPATGTPIRRLPGDTESRPLELGGPLDMLGFMGGITSELEQKHLDLTSGLAASTGSPAPQSLQAGSVANSAEEAQFGAERRSTLSPGALNSLVDGVSIGSASDAATTRGSWSDPGNTTYEEQLLQHFLMIDPPVAIFGPVNMEWKYVRPSVLAHARNFSPLLNAVYCYSDVHKAVLEGNRWRWAPTYYRVASSEMQACLLGDVTDSTLVKVMAAVFFLMLSEVGWPRLHLKTSQLTSRSFSPLRSYARQVHHTFTRHIFFCNDSTTVLAIGPDWVICLCRGSRYSMSSHLSLAATATW